MRRIRSSFPGRIEELPGIYADNFENPDEQNARAYFLSHYHTDHIQGLHSKELLKYLLRNNVTIYATELTVAMIDHDKSDGSIMECVKGLKMGSSLITLPGLTEEAVPELMTVTLIPAGHCAGSTMFLFATETTNILYTGDFRMNTTDIQKYKHLHNKDEPIKIDTLYIDTTFIHGKYVCFPKRSESVEKIVYEIRKWLEVEGNAVALHTSARYGYEFVFNEIYKHLGVKVQVGSDMWRFYSSIQHLVPGVTNERTKVHLCCNKNEKISHSRCIDENDYKFLFIHLSAMKWDHFTSEECLVRRATSKRMDVCFATHCSREEIEQFVEYFKPNKIVGFPNAYNLFRGKRKLDNDDDEVSNENARFKRVDANLLRFMFE